MNIQRIFSAVTSTVSVAVVSGAVLGYATNARAGMPDALEQIVYGDEKRLPKLVVINDVPFGSLSSFADTPQLIWLADVSLPAPFAMDSSDMEDWLDRAAPALGYEGFEAQFTGLSEWRHNDVWNFDLVRDGLTFMDARIEVHWEKGTFLGIAVNIPGNIVSIEDRDTVTTQDGEWVYYAVRTGARSYELMPQQVERYDCGDRVEMIIDAPDRLLRRVEFKPRQPIFDDFEFVEYSVPSGTFPDQISCNVDDVVWLSQPNNDWVTKFDPNTEQFTQYPTTGGSGPDGLIVGTQGRVWTGLYYNGGLGMYDIDDNQFTNYPAPYGNPAMAIPVECTDGKVWVTDHQNNRISEFDPDTETFLQSLVMPQSSCWVVQGHEDFVRQQVYFTEYNTNMLGRIDLGGSTVTDIPVSTGGPAFCYYSDGKVYYSLWTRAVLGVYDVITTQNTEYAFPVSGESGGPMWGAPGGEIIVGTRSNGYIMVFHPDTEDIMAYKIPSATGLKDGLTVASDGTIWFTGTYSNKIAKLLLLGAPCPADVNGDDEVNIDDVFSVLQVWGTCDDCPEDINQDGMVDIDDVFEVLANWGPCP